MSWKQYRLQPVVLVDPATGEALAQLALAEGTAVDLAPGAVVALAADTEVLATIKGSTLVEQLTEADVVGGDLTFSAVVDYVEIVNTDAGNAGTFTVNGVAIVVPAETIVGPIAVGTTPAAVVAVAGATTYIVSRYS